MFYPGMVQQERLVGGPLWGEQNVKLWVRHDPTFHLDRIRTPLLIEDYVSSYQWFDVFALMRRNNRPVELRSFPGGAHVLIQPWQRLAAQEAVVDWYDFWLNDHEDATASKTAQYARWRGLRSQQSYARQQAPLASSPLGASAATH
jgi:hypothetical protein